MPIKKTKSEFKNCPYCDSKIKARAIKCQYCWEFFNEEGKNAVRWNKTREVNGVKKWSKRRKWWLVLMLMIPAVIVIWLLVSVIFWFIGTASAGASYNSTGVSLLYTIRSFISRILSMLSMFWIIWFIPWLIMFLKPDTDYDSEIELKTKSSDLYHAYEPYFNISSLPNSDIQNMKYNWFISRLHVARAVIFNVLTFWLFSTMYYGLKHSDLPKIKPDDFSAWKAIGYLFIPFYNLYRFCVFWLRLVDRVNFQYTLRDKEGPVSRTLTIVFLVFSYIPYLNFINIVLWNILVWQLQSAINGLVAEKYYLRG